MCLAWCKHSHANEGVRTHPASDVSPREEMVRFQKAHVNEGGGGDGDIQMEKRMKGKRIGVGKEAGLESRPPTQARSAKYSANCTLTVGDSRS